LNIVIVEVFGSLKVCHLIRRLHFNCTHVFTQTEEPIGISDASILPQTDIWKRVVL
jgi:hypothetical protein